MPRLWPITAFICAAVTSTVAADDGPLPRDLTRRETAPGPEANDVPLPFPFSLFTGDATPDQSSARHRTDSSLGALHARNRYGTKLTCIGAPCAAMTPTPISPQDRAILMQRGVPALPPDVPVFQKPPPKD